MTTCLIKSKSAPKSTAQQAMETQTTNNAPNARRSYQRGWSKQIIKDSRYKLSGRIHRNGTVATSMQSWLVVASSTTDPQADRLNHSNTLSMLGLTSVASDSLGGPEAATASELIVDVACFKTRTAHQAAQHAKVTYSAVHRTTC